MSEKIYKILANVDQGLTEEEKHQARTNIAAIAGVNVATAGGTTPLVPDENDRVTVDLTDIEGGVPPYTSSDEGKVLGVVGSSDPELQWVTQSGGSSSVVYVTTSNTYEEVYAIYDAGKLPVLKAGTYADNQFYYVLTQVNLSSGHYLHRGVMLFTRWNGTSTNGYTYCMAGNFGIGQYACWRNGQGATQWTSNFSTILPSYSSADSGKVLTVDTNNEPAWVTPSGGSSYSEGSGISISQNNEISAKVDGSSITVNSSGELQAASQLPSYSSADSGKSLVVNGNGDGLTWDNRIDGNLVVSNGQGSTTSQDLQTLRINLSGGMDGLVRVRPVGGSIAIAGWLVPDTDGSTEAGCYPTPYIGSTSSPGLRWRKDPMDIEQLTKVTRSYGTSTTQELSITAGNWYEVTITNNAVVRIALETSSTDTVHTIIVVKGDSAASTAWANIDYFTEMSTARYIACDLSSTSANVTARVFDVYIKGGFRVENIPRSFCRVRELEPSTFHT